MPSLDYATPKEGSSDDDDDDDDDHELDAQALVMQLAAINEGRRPMVDAKPRAAVPGASACWHHLMGTCNKGKDCSFSHEKAEGMALLKLLKKTCTSQRRRP